MAVPVVVVSVLLVSGLGHGPRQATSRLSLVKKEHTRQMRIRMACAESQCSDGEMR